MALWCGSLCAVALGVGPAQAAPALYDPMLRATADPDFLSARQAVLRQHLLDLGVDPMRGGRPTLDSVLQRRMASGARWDALKPARTVERFEVDWPGGLVKLIRHPESHLFHTNFEENLVGIRFEPERDFADSLLVIEVVDIENWNRQWVAIAKNDAWHSAVRNKTSTEQQGGLALNFRIPIRIPRSLERIIGRGDATNIRITGQESIKIGGESTVRNDFVANEFRQNQSLFPSLEMEQRLRVEMNGTVGEKIHVRVSHNSDAGFGQKSTEVKLEFKGDEDDIVQGIRAGDIDVTLPGSGLLGIGASRGGLFGLRVSGAMGPMDYTLFTSKEQSQTNSRSFSSSGGTPTPFNIESVNYVRDRFFRLVAPTSFYFDASTPDLQEIVTDESSSWDVNGWRIDPTSIEVYISATGLLEDDSIPFARAYIDTVGIGWQAAGQPVRIAELAAMDEELTAKSSKWRPLEVDSDWFVLQDPETAAFDGIMLRSAVPPNEALAVSFDIVDAAGVLQHRVGQRRNAGDAPIEDPFGGGEGFYFKLLKLPESRTADPAADAFAGSPEKAVTWEYVLRNFYDLRGTGIDPTKIELVVQDKSGRERPDQMEAPPSVDWVRVFGLDNRGLANSEEEDGVADFQDTRIFYLDLGVMRFPDQTPFATSAAEAASLAPGLSLSAEQAIELDERSADAGVIDIYRRYLTTEELNARSTFQIAGQHTSTSSRLNLNTFNIKEGSETVTLDGRPLTRDTHYTIDYFSGEIILTGAAAELNAQSQISVDFEVDPLFGGGRTSLHGIHLGYELGRQKSLSTTWLLQSEPTTATRPRLGEEPNRTYVGNLATKLRFTPFFLTRMANWLPYVASDQNSTVNFDAEVAVSVPNPNTLRQGYVEDFEAADESIVLTMSRDAWTWASLPAVPDSNGVDRLFQPQDRAFTRWFQHTPSVLREELNPELSAEEKRDVVQSLELRMISTDANEDPATRQWQPGEYGGIMRGFPGQIDLSRAQYLEFWVNDYTGDVDASMREGTLHFDFGTINEDFWWQSTAFTNDEVPIPIPFPTNPYTLGFEDSEDYDYINDLTGGVLDTGLDAIFSDEESGTAFPLRPGQGGDPGGDDFSAAEVISPPPGGKAYLANELRLYINGTEGNRKVDREDLDLNRVFNKSDGYYTLELPLSTDDEEITIVDIYRDYSDPGFLADSRAKGNAWRKYRLDLRNLRVVRSPSGDAVYTPANPDLSRISHFRIWYENPDGTTRKANPNLVFAEMRFLGNRWLADGIRDTRTGEILSEPERGLGEEFRLGVVNNKEYTNYYPPVFPDTRNNVAEKEQSLQFNYKGLREGDEIRARQTTPGGQKLDFLLYGEHSWFWRLPYANPSDTSWDTAQGRLEAFYWVGTDSTNYYEISMPFAGLTRLDHDWHEARIDLGELSNLRVQGGAPDTLYVGTENAVAVTRGTIQNTQTDDVYDVVIRGRPDLRRVSRFYVGVRYPDNDDGIVDPDFDGDVLLNEIRLRSVDRDVGFAERVAMNVNIPKFGDVSGEFRQTDEAFRGLNEKRGSNILRRNWSLRGSSAVQNLLPTLGFEIPISANIRQDSQLPRYQANSDIELIDSEQRKLEETRNTSNQYAISLGRSKPSSSKWLQYTIDPFSYSRSETYSERVAPLIEHSSNRSVSQRFRYDVRLGRGYEATVPWLDWKFRYLPNQLSAGADFDYNKSGETRRTRDGEFERRVPITRHDLKNNLQINHTIADNIRASFTMASNRDLQAKSTEGDTLLAPTKLFGYNFGLENGFSQSMNLTYTPRLPIVRIFEPEIGFNTRYSEDRDSNKRQRLAGSDNDFVGVGHQVRRVANGADLSVRGSVDLFGWLKRRLARSRSNPPPQPQGPGRGDPRQGGAVPGRNGTEAQNRPQPLPVQASSDSTRVQDDDPGQADQPTQPGEADGDVEQPEERFAPREAIGNLFKPFTNFFGKLRPLSVNYNLNRGSNFAHVNSRANWLYRLGWIVGEDNEAAGLTDPVDESVGAGPFSSSGSKRDTSIQMSTQSQLFDNTRVDMNFRRNQAREQGTLRPGSRTKMTELGTGMNISQVNEWGLFRNWFSQAGIQFNYKYSTDSRATGGNAEYPNIRHSYNPRINGTLNNGVSTSVNVQFSTSAREDNTKTEDTSNQSVSLDIQHRFDADGALRFLRFGRKGTGTTIDMTFNMSFRNDSINRKPRGGKIQTTGSRTWNFEPRFQYQFSRNVRGGLQLRYSRRTQLGTPIGNTQTLPTTQTFGIFFDATLNF